MYISLDIDKLKKSSLVKIDKSETSYEIKILEKEIKEAENKLLEISKDIILFKQKVSDSQEDKKEFAFLSYFGVLSNLQAEFNSLSAKIISLKTRIELKELILDVVSKIDLIS